MDWKQKVLYVRSILKLSQTELGGEILSVSPITISRWENSKSRPTKREMMAFHLYYKQQGIDFANETEIKSI